MNPFRARKPNHFRPRTARLHIYMYALFAPVTDWKLGKELGKAEGAGIHRGDTNNPAVRQVKGKLDSMLETMREKYDGAERNALGWRDRWQARKNKSLDRISDNEREIEELIPLRAQCSTGVSETGRVKRFCADAVCFGVGFVIDRAAASALPFPPGVQIGFALFVSASTVFWAHAASKRFAELKVMIGPESEWTPTAIRRAVALAFWYGVCPAIVMYGLTKLRSLSFATTAQLVGSSELGQHLGVLNTALFLIAFLSYGLAVAIGVMYQLSTPGRRIENLNDRINREKGRIEYYDDRIALANGGAEYVKAVRERRLEQYRQEVAKRQARILRHADNTRRRLVRRGKLLGPVDGPGGSGDSPPVSWPPPGVLPIGPGMSAGPMAADGTGSNGMGR